jgi:uncharacterized protein YndB with AHSA1/START domain
MTNASPIPALVLRRTYKAERRRVFEAWTTPEIAATFMGPGDATVPEIHMDVRPGGAYSITMLRADGERMVVKGVYREVVAPERLSMTWSWEEDDPADERETLLTVEFHEKGDETELVLTHEWLASAGSRERHEHGWTLVVDQLAGIVS